MMTNYEQKFKCFQKFNNRRKLNKTKSESLFKDFLLELGVQFREERGFLSELRTFYMADFCLGKPYRIVVEIDGGYHSSPEQVLKDGLKDEYFLFRRYHVIRFKAEDVEERLDWVKEVFKEFMQEALIANKSSRLRKDRPVLYKNTYKG